MQDKEWNIKSRSEVCRICAHAFQNGQEFSTVLADEQGELVRNDVCDNCWDDDRFRSNSFSIWRSVVRFPPPKSDGPLKKETSESLLRRLMETDEHSQRDVIFVLAVDLERRRIFEERDIELLEDGTKNRIYEHKKTGEVFIVHDPDLNLRELEDVQGRVLELLISGEPSIGAKPTSAQAEDGGDGEGV